MGEREGYSHSNASSKDSLTLHRKSVSDFWMEPRAGQTMLALHRGPWNWRRKEGAKKDLYDPDSHDGVITHLEL